MKNGTFRFAYERENAREVQARREAREAALLQAQMCSNCGRPRDIPRLLRCSACVQSDEACRARLRAHLDFTPLPPKPSVVPKHIKYWPVPLPGSIAWSMAWSPRT